MWTWAVRNAGIGAGPGQVAAFNFGPGPTTQTVSPPEVDVTSGCPDGLVLCPGHADADNIDGISVRPGAVVELQVSDSVVYPTALYRPLVMVKVSRPGNQSSLTCEASHVTIIITDITYLTPVPGQAYAVSYTPSKCGPTKVDSNY